MTGETRFKDFQISLGPVFADPARIRPIAHDLFATYEAVRLWLKGQRVAAPFQKLSIVLNDGRGRGGTHTHRRAGVVAGVCLVTQWIDVEELQRRSRDLPWLVSLTKDALDGVAKDLDWRSDDLERALDDMAACGFPLTHWFKNLARADPSRAVQYEPWMLLRPGETQIGVRIVRPDGTHEDRILRRQLEPIWLEDDFPVAKAVIRDGYFLLLAENGSELARLSDTIDSLDPA